MDIEIHYMYRIHFFLTQCIYKIDGHDVSLSEDFEKPATEARTRHNSRSKRFTDVDVATTTVSLDIHLHTTRVFY